MSEYWTISLWVLMDAIRSLRAGICFNATAKPTVRNFQETCMTVDIICPKCDHSNIRKKNHGQRAGAVIGAGAGAMAGWGGLSSGVQAGATLGASWSCPWRCYWSYNRSSYWQRSWRHIRRKGWSSRRQQHT